MAKPYPFAGLENVAVVTKPLAELLDEQGIPFVKGNLGLTVAGRLVTMLVNGVPVSVTSRRKRKVWHTWVYAYFDIGWVLLRGGSWLQKHPDVCEVGRRIREYAACRFSLSCNVCDTGMGIDSRAEAEAAGWQEIEPDDGLSWTHLGTCPECWKEENGEKDESP